ncbi:HAD family hydrolase [soil metagenome]
MRPVLVLDLDGTLALGDAPVLAYARQIELLAPRAKGLTSAVTAFLDDPGADERLQQAQDGYQAVHALSQVMDVPSDLRDRAYALSRAALADDLGDVRAPRGLLSALSEIDADVVLVTNSPRAGLDSLLARLGVADVVSEIRTDAGKPLGMLGLLTDLLQARGLADDPGRLMSVGDIWANDLAPALELGCATAYVDAFDRHQGPAHVRARTLPELYPALIAWARDPAEFLRAHPLPAQTTSGQVTTSTGPTT